MIGGITIREHSMFLGGISVLVLLIAGLAIAADTDDVIIGVNISQSTSIDISPGTVNWTGLNIGETGTPVYFDVTNMGSVNITGMRANITNDASNPYGTGSPSNYNAGDFILLNTSSSAFYYVNKENWNESVPGQITSPTDWTEGADTGYFGIIRTASDGDVGQQYYFFTNRTGASGDCRTGSGELYIGKTPRNLTSSGTVDFSSGSNFDTVTLSANGVGNVSAGDFEWYCVVVTADCSKVTLFKWNTDLDVGSGCSNDAAFYDGTAPNELTPGSSTSFWLEPKIPNGVPDGDIYQGTLTVIASAT